MRKSNIIIDEINTSIDQVPFPSITICPSSRVDWVKAQEFAERYIPKGNEIAKYHFLKILDKAANMRFSNMRDLQINVNDSSVLKILNGDIL